MNRKDIYKARYLALFRRHLRPAVVLVADGEEVLCPIDRKAIGELSKIEEIKYLAIKSRRKAGGRTVIVRKYNKMSQAEIKRELSRLILAYDPPIGPPGTRAGKAKKLKNEYSKAVELAKTKVKVKGLV